MRTMKSRILLAAGVTTALVAMADCRSSSERRSAADVDRSAGAAIFSAGAPDL